MAAPLQAVTRPGDAVTPDGRLLVWSSLGPLDPVPSAAVDLVRVASAAHRVLATRQPTIMRL
jgi:hypothetical protein